MTIDPRSMFSISPAPQPTHGCVEKLLAESVVGSRWLAYPSPSPEGALYYSQGRKPLGPGCTEHRDAPNTQRRAWDAIRTTTNRIPPPNRTFVTPPIVAPCRDGTGEARPRTRPHAPR